jgi:hypothetical protein
VKRLWTFLWLVSLTAWVGAAVMMFKRHKELAAIPPPVQEPTPPPETVVPVPEVAVSTPTVAVGAVPVAAPAPATPPASGDETAPSATPKPAQAEKVKHKFSYKNGKAQKVGLSGDFNAWNPAPMAKKGENRWSLTVSLKPGDYAYQFVVDGEPQRDPSNPRSDEQKRSLLTIVPPSPEEVPSEEPEPAPSTDTPR